MFLNIVFFSCVCLFVPCVYVIKIIIIVQHLSVIIIFLCNSVERIYPKASVYIMLRGFSKAN